MLRRKEALKRGGRLQHAERCANSVEKRRRTRPTHVSIKHFHQVCWLFLSDYWKWMFKKPKLPPTKNVNFNLHFVSTFEHEGISSHHLSCTQMVSMWPAHWSVYMHVCKTVSICLYPGRFTVQLMGPQPSHGGAAGKDCHYWSSWVVVRTPGALGHPGIGTWPTLLSLEHLLG